MTFDVLALLLAAGGGFFAAAIGALHAAYKRGLRVPTDLSVTGFDDIAVARVSVPALTRGRFSSPEVRSIGTRAAPAGMVAESAAATARRPTERRKGAQSSGRDLCSRNDRKL